MGRILVLGGTEFLGVHLVEGLLAAGHDVTLLNRGKTNRTMFAQVPRIWGDRDADVSRLAGGAWDTVYDLSGYEPAHIDRVADQLGEDVRYVFVSTVSVYADLSAGPLTEDSPVMSTPVDEVDREAVESYGELKALAEDTVRARFDDHVIVRPTVICGPHDPSDRVTYWVTRMAEPGVHLVPDPLDVPVQFVDVRDLSRWLVEVGGADAIGTFNAAAPPLPLGEFLDSISQHTCSTVTRIGISADDMAAQKLHPWTEMPMWLPPSDTAMRAFFDVDAGRAVAAGLRFRSLEDTIDGILHWADRDRMLTNPRFGINSVREEQILQALSAASSS